MADTGRSRFEVTAGRSAVLIEARSNVGRIAFGTTEVDGFVEVSTQNGAIDLAGASPTAELVLRMDTFTSGNSVYDAELLHRIDARQFPTTRVELRVADRIGQTDRYEVGAELSFHGVSRQIAGTVGVQLDPEGRLRVSGEHVFDIRDFEVAAPSVLMLRIYPDVRVELQLEATATP